MEVEDLHFNSFRKNEDEVDLFLYDPMPGGSGLLKQIIENWERVRSEGLAITNDCKQQCDTACYECMKSYRNVFYHDALDRHKSAEILEQLETIEIRHDIPENVVEESGDGENTLPSEERLETNDKG